MLQYRGQTHDEAVEQLKSQGEERLKTSLAMREVVRNEGITVSDDDIQAEVERMLGDYEEAQRDNARAMLTTQLRSTVATAVLNQKLRDRLFKLATGAATDEDEAAPALPAAEVSDEVAPVSDAATPAVDAADQAADEVAVAAAEVSDEAEAAPVVAEESSAEAKPVE